MTVKNILISQNTPRVLTPYQAITEKYGVEFEFRPFFLIEPLTSREFRAQRINILDYTAIVFSSRHAIDAFFTLAEELRCKIPETMKYFCTTEVVAMYLQKHIVYRKRKIFYGTGTPDSVVALIGPKHKGEKFLIAASDNSNNETLYRLFDAKGLDYSTGVFVKSVSQDLKDVDLHAYDMVVLYNPADVKSRPLHRQGDGGSRSFHRSEGPLSRGSVRGPRHRTVPRESEVEAAMAATLSKSERLCGKTAIAGLMEHGKGSVAGCLRFKCLVRDDGDAVSRILVSVPKRSFKRAVKRNLLKRRIRESYRLQKELLPAGMDIAFIYVSREVLPFEEIYSSMTAALTAAAQQVTA